MKYQKYLPHVSAAVGVLLLAATAVVCNRLGHGGPQDHVWVALVLFALAGLAALLVWLESRCVKWALMALLPIGLGMLLRALCLDRVTGDLSGFLTNWYNYFADNGGFAAIAHSVGDYNVPYLYFIAAISYLRMPAIYLYKLFSILFDVLLAWGCFRLVRSLKGTQRGVAAPLAAFSLALLLPTVVVNGAYWAQCDAIYGALAVHAASLALDGKDCRSVLLLGVAFAFKLQTVFILPLWGVMWLAGRVRFRALWMFPLSYLAVIAPAVAMGKPLGDILSVYTTQMGEYPRLTLNAPSIFQLLPYGTEEAGPASLLGIAAAAALVLVMLAVGLRLRDRMDTAVTMTVAVLLVIGIPFLLPHMHERYFFLADVFTLCWACAQPRRVPVAVLTCGASLASYFVYLRGRFHIPLQIGGNKYGMLVEMSAMLLALLWTVCVFIRQLRALPAQDPLK